MNGPEREDRAIDAWCRVLSIATSTVVTVMERPDRADPGRGGCDALCERNGTRCAVEHTSVDSYARRREDDDRYSRVVLPVATAVEAMFDDSWIELEIPVHAIPSGQNWDHLRDSLSARTCEAIAGVEIADYHDLSRRRFDWPDVPFPVWISRQPRGDGDKPTCVIFRQAPADLHEQLTGDMRRALDDKGAQLDAYKRQGHPTVLLLDFDDIVLLNRELVAEAFARALRGHNGASVIDEVFLVDSGRRPPWVYPVKLAERVYPNLPEFGQFFSAQYHANYRAQPDARLPLE